MLRNDCARIRQGDLFHGRYRILRVIENDRAGAMYEALDMMTNAHRILRVVQAEALAGTGIRIRFKSDEPLLDAGNVAFLSDAGLDDDTRSLFLIMDLAEDSELEPITRQRVIHVDASGTVNEDVAVVNEACAMTRRRASVPLPLPPPLPLPTPPPPRPSQASMPLLHESPRSSAALRNTQRNERMFGAAHFLVLAGIATGVGSVVYFGLGPAESRPMPDRTGMAMVDSPETFAANSSAPMAFEMAPRAAASAVAATEANVPDASVPANWLPSEAESKKPEASVPETALPAQPITTPTAITPPKTTPPKTSIRETAKPIAAQPTAPPATTKPSATSGRPAQTKRHRESIF